VRWRDRSAGYRWAVVILAAGVMAPSLVDSLFRAGITPWKDVNLSSVAMLATGGAWAWVVWKCDLLNLVSLGRAAILDGVLDMVFILDNAGRLTDCNQGAVRLLGRSREDWIGRKAGTLPAPWGEILEGGKPGQSNVGDSIFDVHSTPVRGPAGPAVGRVVALHDITAAIQMKRQALDAHRMEVVGRMAGGIAHEFNNLLTVIVGYTEILRRSHATGDAEGTCIGEIATAAERARTLIAQLLSFSQRQMLQPATVNFNEAIEGFSAVLREAAGECIQVGFALQPGIPSAHVDREQLEEVLLEAVANARDAMGDRGTIEIRTADPGDGKVWIEVRDNGPGVDLAIRDRIFEPFFTTGHPSQRTGLGLSMIHGFAAQSGGSVTMEEAPGGGALLRLKFPAAAQD